MWLSVRVFLDNNKHETRTPGNKSVTPSTRTRPHSLSFCFKPKEFTFCCPVESDFVLACWPAGNHTRSELVCTAANSCPHDSILRHFSPSSGSYIPYPLLPRPLGLGWWVIQVSRTTFYPLSIFPNFFYRYLSKWFPRCYFPTLLRLAYFCSILNLWDLFWLRLFL